MIDERFLIKRLEIVKGRINERFDDDVEFTKSAVLHIVDKVIEEVEDLAGYRDCVSSGLGGFVS